MAVVTFNKQTLGCRLPDDYLLLSIGLATFVIFEAQEDFI